MAVEVGGLVYEVSMETQGLLTGQKKVDRALKETSGTLDQFDARLTAVMKGVTALGAALAALKVAKLADEMRLLSARVEVAAGSIELGAEALRDLEVISRRSQTSLAANAEVFTRLNQSILAMGGTQRDTLVVTDLLGKAIKVSGANAVEAKSAMLQFGQALGSGKLQGDELRSLMENAPYLMKQLADGVGVPTGALKKLGEEGKLTADVVTNALTKAATKINEDFKKFPQTIESAMQVAEDSAALAALKFDQLSGSSAALTGAVKGVGEVLDELANQFSDASEGAGDLGRNDAVASWAKTSRLALSYLIDAADMVWQTISVLGRNVAYVLTGVGTEIGGIGAQIKAVMNGDFARAKAIGEEMTADADRRRAELDAADAKSLNRAKLAGQQMRDAWEQGSAGGSGALMGPPAPGGKLRPTGGGDDEQGRKMAGRRAAAQAYLQGLVADNRSALEKIDAEEQKALSENQKRMAMDKANADIYAKAKIEIHQKFARVRAALEEKSTREIAQLNIATTIDEMERIEAIKREEFRRSEADQRLGVKTAEEAARARALAEFHAANSYADLAERNARARAEAMLAVTRSQEQRIAQIRDEAIRQAEEGYRRGQHTFEEAEAAKSRAQQAAVEQRKALEQSRTNAQLTTLQYRAGGGDLESQEELIRAQAAVALSAAEEARQGDLEAQQIYADQKVAIEADMNRRIADLRANANMAGLNAMAEGLGAMTSALKSAGAEQSGIYKAMFAAQKAFSIASSVVAITSGIAKAADNPWPLNLAAMGSVFAATAGLVSTIKGTNYGGGRQYGGPVTGGSLYRVNETGRPEMFTAANGSQYMLPTANGSVTPANQVGAGGMPNITVVFNTSTQLQEQSRSWNEQTRTVEIAVAEVAQQIGNNSGPVWSAMRGSTNVQPRI